MSTKRNRPLKTGKNDEGKDYAYQRRLMKRLNDEARAFVRDRYGDECSLCGFVDSGWHEPKPNGEVKSLTLYHHTFDLGRHRYEIGGGGERNGDLWGVNLYRWIHQRYKGGTDLTGLFRLICNDCKRDKGLG